MSVLKVRALVLKEEFVGEADKRITIFAKEQGKMCVSCRGARKPKSKFLACTQLFSYSDFILYKGVNFYSLTQGELLKSFYSIRDNLDVLSSCVYLLELFDKTTLENVPQDEALLLLLKALSKASKKDCNIIQITKVFELKFLYYLGYAPEMKMCTLCGSTEQLNYFSACDGGIVCKACVSEVSNAIKMSEASICAMNYILEADTAKAFQFDISSVALIEMEKAINTFLHIHL